MFKKLLCLFGFHDYELKLTTHNGVMILGYKCTRCECWGDKIMISTNHHE